MSGQRPSGHKLQPYNLYETPPWVVLDGLVGFFPVTGLVIGETACGTGKMVRALLDAGAAQVLPSDIKWRPTKLLLPHAKDFKRFDFTKRGYDRPVQRLTTNPPYGDMGTLAERFIERGLEAMRRHDGPEQMDLLLAADFDMAGKRIHLFDRCPEFHGVIRLRRRIEWFARKKKKNPETGKMETSSGPSKYHSWFIWKKEPRAIGAHPIVLYAPSTGLLI